MNHFSIGLWHAMKSGFYTTTSNDELSGWTKKKLQSTSQSQTCTTKRSWSLFGGLLPIQSTTALWTPAKPLYLRSMLSKSMRCTETCQQNGRGSSPWQHQPHVAQPMLQKLNYQVLTHPLYSTDHLPTNYHSFNHLDNLLQGKIFPQSAGGRKCFPRVPWILQHRFLCYMNKLFFVGKNMLIVMVLVLINEDVFEPSYNDLKLMLQNCNYICTSLIVGMSNVTFPRALDLSLQACSPCKSSLHSKCHQHPRVAHIPLGVTLISSFSPSNHTYTCIIHHHPSATHASSHLQNTSCMSLFLTTSNAMIPDTLAWVSAILAAIHTWLFSMLPHLSLFPPPESPK